MNELNQTDAVNTTPILWIVVAAVTVVIIILLAAYSYYLLKRLHKKQMVAWEQDELLHCIEALQEKTGKEGDKDQNNDNIKQKYAYLFESALVAISYFDKEGKLIVVNENMRKLCEFGPKSEPFFRNTCMFDLPTFHGDFDPKSPYHLHTCQHMVYEEFGIDKYIEIRVVPVYQKGELNHYIVTARDITNERDMYKKLHKSDSELNVVNSQISEYEQKLSTLLKNSEMWIWRSNLKKTEIDYTRSLQDIEKTLQFQSFAEYIEDDYYEEAMKAFYGMEGTAKNINTTLPFRRTPVSDGPAWLAISGIPTYDDEGNLTGHFGITRDVTKLMEAQEQLRRETSRAEDSGKLKSIFLANMTHEIRTPLNAIVGFSDLLQMIDNSEERREFIRIIRNNCDMLIRLIDDIIEASSMGQGSIAIENEEVDFATLFNDVCQALAQRVENPAIEFISDNPYSVFRTRIDKGRLQQVITNFTTNAIKYTQKGHIKVSYRYIAGNELPKHSSNKQDDKRMGIYVYCEDTGSGIPKDKQNSIFERFVKLNDFVQGTGLGLSICKSIADRCKGHIGVTSEGEGKGSTFWIWIPCERMRAPLQTS